MPESEKIPIRKRTYFLCALDGKQLELVSGTYRSYYACPKHFAYGRELGEETCENRLSLKEANKLYAALEEMEEEGRLAGGEEEEVGDIYLNIRSASDDEVEVYVLNRKSTGLY